MNTIIFDDAYDINLVSLNDIPDNLKIELLSLKIGEGSSIINKYYIGYHNKNVIFSKTKPKNDGELYRINDGVYIFTFKYGLKLIDADDADGNF